MPSSTIVALLLVAVSVIATTNSTAMSGMVGGHVEQDASDPAYMERARKAAKVLNDASNEGPNHMMPIKVLSAKSQVVAGVKYTFQVLYGESNCKKGDYSAADLNATNCTLKSGGRRALYDVELFERPFENFEQYNVTKIRDCK
ncbi:hypothetical protein KIN20_030675 [Parelaphostrongylus tenuis]|uniref:Cystatin domain-containing protein n=1 Tax=Parelaphostrongylus tenuis TaxID=148309 RepID=A0AAD5R4K3_PARTN|nr:hypothetical protein KIN20_030675 [Parelaphostrongylus tenuis]